MDTCFCSWSGQAADVTRVVKEMYSVDLSDMGTVLSQDYDLNVIAVEFRGGPDFKCCAVVDTGCMKGYIMEEKH
jgi:hypothetical protein